MWILRHDISTVTTFNALHSASCLSTPRSPYMQRVLKYGVSGNAYTCTPSVHQPATCLHWQLLNFTDVCLKASQRCYKTRLASAATKHMSKAEKY